MVRDVMLAGDFSGESRVVKFFEERFAKFAKRKHAIAVNSGGSALFLALKALGVGFGDDVITPAFGMIADGVCIAQAGARAVFFDEEQDVREVVTPNTKVLIIPQIYGFKDNSALIQWAHQNGIRVIEDLAEVHGWQSEEPADILVYSFYANKIIQTGEGGMLATDDPELAAELSGLRRYHFGKEDKYFSAKIGYSMNMTAMQAAMGLSQLKPERVQTEVLARRLRQNYYMEHIKGDWFPIASGVIWLCGGTFGDRAGLEAHLFRNGIETRRYFHPLPAMPMFADGKRYPGAENLREHGLLLPSSVSDFEQEYVVKKINEFYTYR